MKIPDEVIQSIRERVDFLALVQKRVELKRIGRSWKGLCPFHNEKTPSFHVHPERAFYHCFGCQASGDVFKFIMETEHQPFPIVARELAKSVGIEIPEQEESAEEKRAREKREWLYRTNDYLNQYFVHQLWNARDAARARAYVEQRGLSEETARSFQLGYAPRRADDVLAYLEAKRLPKELAIELGVLGKRDDGSIYLRFFDRLLFPIHDERDRIAGFGGRVLDPDAKAAKYLNSPESPIFKKSRLLYGYSKAKNSIARKGSAWLCEGYLDVIALHQAGLDQACAPLGTALTEDHLPLLRRVTSRICTMFDGDAAGLRATRKSVELLLAHGLAVNVVALREGDDPDTWVLREGAEAVAKNVAAAPAAVQFFIDKAARELVPSVEGRIEAAKDIGPLLHKLPSQLERDLYVTEAAKRLEIEERQLRRFFGFSVEQRSPEQRPAKNLPQPQALPATIASEEPRIPPPEAKELELCRPILRVRRSWTEALPRLRELVSHEGLKRLLGVCVENPENVDFAMMVEELGSEQTAQVFARAWEPEDRIEWDDLASQKLVAAVIAQFEHYSIGREIMALTERLQGANDAGEIEALQREKVALIRRQRALKRT